MTLFIQSSFLINLIFSKILDNNLYFLNDPLREVKCIKKEDMHRYNITNAHQMEHCSPKTSKATSHNIFSAQNPLEIITISTKLEKKLGKNSTCRAWESFLCIMALLFLCSNSTVKKTEKQQQRGANDKKFITLFYHFFHCTFF